MLHNISHTDGREHEALRYLQTALEEAAAVSLTRDAQCPSTLAVPLQLDLALLAPDEPRAHVGMQFSWVELSNDRTSFEALTRAVRLAAFTSIELKAAHAPVEPMRSLKAWCREVRPRFFSLWCIRVDDDALFHEARALLSSLSAYCNAVGVLFHRARMASAGPELEKRAAPELSLGFALREMALELSTLARTEPVTGAPENVTGPRALRV